MCLSEKVGFAAKKNFRERLEGIVEKAGKSLFVFFVIGAALFSALMITVRYSEFMNYSDRAAEDSAARSQALLMVLKGNVDDAMKDVVSTVRHIANVVSSRPETNVSDLLSLARSGSEQKIGVTFVDLNGIVLNSTKSDAVGKPTPFMSLIQDVKKIPERSVVVSTRSTCLRCKNSHFLVAAQKVVSDSGKTMGILIGYLDPFDIGSISDSLGDAFGGATLAVFDDGRSSALDKSKIGERIENSEEPLINLQSADRSGKTVIMEPGEKYQVSYKYLETPGIFIAYARDKREAAGPWHDILMRTVYAGIFIGIAFLVPAGIFAMFLFANAEAQARTRRREEEEDHVRKAAKIAWMHWLHGTDALRMNATSAELLGMSGRDSQSFTNFLDIFPGEEAAALRSAFEDCSRTGTEHRLEITTKQIDSNVPPSTFAITTFRRDPDNVFAVCQDLTEWQEMRSQYAHLMKMDAVGQLTGGIAHDFNNLLVVILGNLEEITMGVSKKDPRYVLLDTALGACMQARELTKQLLAFARKQPLQPSAVDVATLVEGMASLLKRTIGENIKIGLIADKSVKPWRVMADRSQIETAIMNLVINSRDALPNGGDVTIFIRNKTFTKKDVIGLDGLRAGDYVDLAIEDNGIGMAPDITNRAVEPYFTTKPVGSGSGLGLSQVYGFAKQSGGHVQIYSEETRGTLVHLYLPRAKAADYPEVHLDPMENGFEFGNETILVVEDEEAVRNHVQRVLTGLGYKVITRIDAKSALKLVDEGVKFDLLLTDVIVPGGMHGDALADKVRKKYPNMPVVYVSGYASGLPESGALRPDVSFLQKPFLRSELAGKIRGALDKVMAA